MTTRVEELQAILRNMGYQFKSGAPGRIQHRYVGPGSQTPEAAALLEELRELVWIQHVCNHAGTVFEAWAAACYELGDILGYPPLLICDGRGAIARGQDGWRHWLARATLQDAKAVTEQLRLQVESLGRPEQLGLQMAAPAE